MSKNKKQEGSIIIFAISILALVVSIAIGITPIFITRLRTSLEAANSTVAIQAADAGIEWCLYVNNGGANPPPKPVLANGATVDVYNDSNNPATCDPSEGSLSYRAIGTYKGISRSFEVSVQPTTLFATGGTITTSGVYTIHTFTSSDTFTVNIPGTVEVLVVGGGGSGGSLGGGGGAGGYRTEIGYAVTPQVYTITVGAGGTSVFGSGGQVGNNGLDSSFDGIIAKGGGGGSGNAIPARNGGSGGGGGNAAAAGTGTAGQGNNGGTSVGITASGGGGAGAIGTGNSGPSAETAGTAGGVGLSSSISGIATFYAGGGGGAGFSQTGASFNGGAGGNGGGGTGGNSLNTPTAQAGIPNTGGGGGGAGYDGTGGGTSTYTYPSGAGGSGIVIIRYLTP